MPLINFDQLDEIIELINDGGIGIIPTETVYGIVCKANNDDAIDRIYEIKGRASNQPLQVLIAEPHDIHKYMNNEILADKLVNYWPGSLTAVVAADELSSHKISNKLIYEGGVGLRCPNDELARMIIEKVGGAVAATSANISKEPPSNDPAIINNVFENQLIILDDGVRNNVTGSTVISYITDPPSLIRQGVLSDNIIQDLMEL